MAHHDIHHASRGPIGLVKVPSMAQSSNQCAFPDPRIAHNQEPYGCVVHIRIMDDFEEIADEEKIRIAKHFLAQSPPGQIQEVVSGTVSLLEHHAVDLKSLIGESVLSRATLVDSLREYNEVSYLPISVSEDNWVSNFLQYFFKAQR